VPAISDWYGHHIGNLSLDWDGGIDYGIKKIKEEERLKNFPKGCLALLIFI